MPIRMIFEKETIGIDHTSIQSSVRGIAKRVVYGGNIEITFHDTTSSTTIQSQVPQAQGNNISLKISWVFEWLDHGHGISTSSNTSNGQQPQRRQQTWSGRLQAAMVDGKQGWIAKDDPVPPGIQFTRALEKYGLVDERIEDLVHQENGLKMGTSGRMRFYLWGCDE